MDKKYSEVIDIKEECLKLHNAILNSIAKSVSKSYNIPEELSMNICKKIANTLAKEMLI